MKNFFAREYRVVAVLMIILYGLLVGSHAFAAAPTATNLSAAETYTEDTPLNLVDIVASDIDSTNLTATLMLSNATAGTLSTGTSGATTSSYNAGTGTWTASGPIADVNVLLAGVTFVPALNYNASFTIATSVSDGSSSVTGSKAVVGIAVNDAPTATNLSAAETYTQGTPLNLVDIVVSDVDNTSVTATLTLSTSSAGSFNSATSGAVTSIYNAGTGTWTASGPIANVNTLLAGLTFTPASGYHSNFTIATSVSDGIAPALTGSKAVTGVAATNSAPVLDASASPVMSGVLQGSGAPSGSAGTAVSNLVDSALVAGGLDNVVDVDSGALLGIAVTATDTTHATYYYSTDGGNTWNAVGAVSSTSSLLLAPSDRIYVRPANGYIGTIPAAITFRAWDQTSGTHGSPTSTTSTGGTTAFSTATDTASIVVTAVPTGFITTWTVTDGQTVTIPTNPNYTYSYDVDWGDSSSSDTSQTGDDSHTYANAGNYTVTITGTFPAIYFNNASDAPALTDIVQWGTNHWQSMSNAFHGCTGLTALSATDVPDFSGVTDMGGMFLNASNFNSDIGSWDVSTVTDMAYMFEAAGSFNQDISSWNVGNVTSMYHMFNTASNFNNGDLGNDGTHPLTWGSHVSKVTNMESMFYYNHAFNQDISGWDVSSVTDMGSMFQGDEVFNNGGHALTWGAKTANVTTMSAMFIDDTAFNQDISSWDIRNVTSMAGMLIDGGLSSANYDALLVAWSAEPVQPSVTFDAGNSPYCSSGATAARTVLTGSPNNWTINDAGTFCGGSAFVTTWNTANPGIDDDNQIIIPTFPGDTYNYNVDWGDGSSVFGQTGDVQHTYADPGIYTVKITGTFPRIYFNDGGSTDAQKILSVEQWGTNHWDSMSAAFAGCVNLVVNAADTPDLSGVMDASYMFLNAASLNQNLNSWNVSNIVNMYGMFQSTTLFDQPLDSWNTSNATNMSYMFENDPAFNQSIGSWNTSKVTDMSYMFRDDSLFNQPLNSWNVASVTSMAGMFVNTDAFNQPLGSWNVSRVVNMNSMFKNNRAFDQDISSWDVSHVTGMMNFFQIGQGGVSSANYDRLLQAWSQEPLQSGVVFVAGASKYCPSAAAARASIISTHSWGILDGGPSGCAHAVVYSAGPGGTVIGGTSQSVTDGSDSTPVTAVPNSGYQFVGWSDRSVQNPRTDKDVLADISVTANFSAISSGGQISGGHAYVSQQSSQVLVTVPVVSTAASFTQNLKKGSTGSDVVRLQKYLRVHGFAVTAAGKETSLFGTATKKELAQFQKSVGLKADGAFGTNTRKYVNSHL